MGEVVYHSWIGWKRKVRDVYPDARIEGDSDVSHALVGDKCVAEWDGTQGTLYGR
jgi:hypothetical protein